MYDDITIHTGRISMHIEGERLAIYEKDGFDAAYADVLSDIDAKPGMREGLTAWMDRALAQSRKPPYRTPAPINDDYRYIHPRSVL